MGAEKESKPNPSQGDANSNDEEKPFQKKMLNKQMRDAMKNEETNMAGLGHKLNSARTQLLNDLKTSISDHIPSDIISVLTDDQPDIPADKFKNADEQLERIIGELFDLKLKAD